MGKKSYDQWRDETADELDRLHMAAPLDEFMVENFADWMAKTSALLAYNPQIQENFRKHGLELIDLAIVSDPHADPAAFMRTSDRLQANLAMAISELRHPTPPIAPVLTEEHGLIWYIYHCPWASKRAFFLCCLGIAVTAFTFGFALGATDFIANTYKNWQDRKIASPSTTNPAPPAIESDSSTTKNATSESIKATPVAAPSNREEKKE